ncbi:patatin-like phospholipase family protein [Methylocella sp.]|jgi:hypothetical protein|uniref:patatin-like phospholipase family protein n=1 Tax=Methylocella sp. TaxID=1978226 RepID=UPI003C2595C6
MTETAGADTATLARDRHFFEAGRKRILSIDGGGVRGVLALGFLERLEGILAENAGRPVRLCDHFDLIGGTSTGAILATALALGYSAADIRSFYLRLGPLIFRRPYFRLPGWQSVFDAEALRREIVSVVGARTLDSPDLQTGLGVMLKRIDAGSSWILTNNPRAAYWETPTDRSFIGNRRYSLANIVRASTAAPHYFDPQLIEIVEGASPALFVDGGLTPHNDPSLALLLAATLPGYHIGWPLGADRLTIVSIGTGSYRERCSAEDLRRASSVTIALRSLVQQIADNQQLTLTLMSWLGKGGPSWPINSEIGDLSKVEPPFGALFRFLRYDVKLETDWLGDTLGVAVSPRDMARLRRFDDPHAMPLLDDLGRRAAKLQMSAADFAAA